MFRLWLISLSLLGGLAAAPATRRAQGVCAPNAV